MPSSAPIVTTPVPPTPVTSEGMLLGAFPDAVPEAASLRLHAGESLVLTTDGITESRDRAGRLFGEAGITRALARATPVTAHEVLDTVIRAVTQHTSGVPTDDDQALLVLTAQ